MTQTYLSRQATTAPSPHAKRPPPGGFVQTDFTEDLKKMDIPTLVMHGDDDQIVPVANAALKSAKILKRATLKVYPGLPHGMCSTNPDQINADLLAFFKGAASAAAALL